MKGPTMAETVTELEVGKKYHRQGASDGEWFTPVVGDDGGLVVVAKTRLLNPLEEAETEVQVIDQHEFVFCVDPTRGFVELEETEAEAAAEEAAEPEPGSEPESEEAAEATEATPAEDQSSPENW